MTECFWCSEVYDSTDHDACPNCAHTEEIKIVTVKNIESE